MLIDSICIIIVPGNEMILLIQLLVKIVFGLIEGLDTKSFHLNLVANEVTL
jgi:hypothetical protein